MKVLIALVLLVMWTAVPALAVEWLALWTEDDSWVAISDEGEIWQLIPGNPPDHVGSLGPGPWVDFARKTQHPHVLYGLRPNGEIWSWEFNAPPTLYRVLPDDRQWCAIELNQEAGAPPGYALTCTGEVWVLADPPHYAGTFSPPVPAENASWGQIKRNFR